MDEANRQLQAGAALAASTMDDPVRKRRLQASMEELEQLAPLHRDAVQRYVQTQIISLALKNVAPTRVVCQTGP
jgi:hypothetical protein